MGRSKRTRLSGPGQGDDSMPIGTTDRTRFGDRPCRPKCGAMLGERHEQFIRNGWTAGRASNVARFPAKHLFEEGPRISECGLGKLRADNLGNLAGVDWRLPERQQPQFLEERRRDDEAHRGHMVEPFEIGIAIDFRSHGAYPDTGQR